jgi:hypothetical protein
MEISKNRNGSRTVCVFKTHYREPGVGTLEVQPYQLDRDFGRYGISDHTSYNALGQSTGASIVLDVPPFLDYIAALLGLYRIKEDKPISQGGSIHYECRFVCNLLP